MNPFEHYPTLDDVERVFEAHVDPGKVGVWRLADMRLVIGERDGARFRDAYSGRWFFNCHSNGGVFNLGHRNPRVIAAVRDALDRVDIGNHHLVSAYRALAAQKLAATTDGRLPGVVFSVGGGEAVDLSLKVARAVTGRRDIVSAHGAFHGHTGLAFAAGDPEAQTAFGHALPGFVHVPFNDLDALDAAVTPDTAAVILEAIPATVGFPMPNPGYLRAVGDLCRDRGALLVLDEVQTGLGRTGSVWFHIQEDARPDMVITGKGLSGGIYPIAATLVTADVHRFFGEHPFAHVSTFGGSEIGCAAASEVVDIVTEDGFGDRVRTLGERFEKAFAPLGFELRRRGLLMGFRFDDDEGGLVAMKELYDRGVWAFVANNDRSVLQFKPALTITDDEAEEIASIVVDAFS